MNDKAFLSNIAALFEVCVDNFVDCFA